ncbi:DUF4435 domain-containing protein [Marinifilum sp. D714]|uniref:DUF4435 domain-containing protein n=1 Tax=Marinifilum sp. D714 TaxID=2937523 RepID=UPI0027C3DA07|nr:DUF4435 domain-containing protein [Marinifilum sp. D714]MDQ2180244.1 DUF4435 domain-containing protein [Marinifilum sp. D714]
MGFLEYLKNAAKSPVTAQTKFMQQYKQADNSIHVFLEGKDDPSFYSNYIERNKRKGQRIYFYNSKNKAGVYYNHSKINWSVYKKERILFFVDKDFSDILNEEYASDQNIFVTRFYSIENYLVSRTLFSRCLREIFGINDDKVIARISKEFVKSLAEFHKAIEPLTSVLLYYRKNNIPVNLNNIDFNQIFNVNIGDKVTVKSNIQQYLVKCTGVKSFPKYTEFKECLSLIKPVGNTKLYVRGKCELWFMIKYLNLLPAIMNQDIAKGEPKIKSCLNITPNNAVQIIAPRLRIPMELKKFLIENLKKKSA